LFYYWGLKLNKLIVTAAAICGLVAVVLMNNYVGKIQSEVVSESYLILSPNSGGLVKGEEIKETHLVRQELPSRFKSLTRLAVRDTPASRQFIIGKKVSEDIEPNSLLLHHYFRHDFDESFASKIEVGKRAFAMPVGTASAVGYFIEPGSRVDILGTFQVKKTLPSVNGAPGALLQRKTETRQLLNNMKVLAVDKITTRSGYLKNGNSGFNTITLEVSPYEAEILIFAQTESRGDLSFVLRNPEDEGISEVPGVSWDSPGMGLR
jgi:Flp pilus assembly protein CpaB